MTVLSFPASISSLRVSGLLVFWLDVPHDDLAAAGAGGPAPADGLYQAGVAQWIDTALLKRFEGA